jgi:hypothetical protein
LNRRKQRERSYFEIWYLDQLIREKHLRFLRSLLLSASGLNPGRTQRFDKNGSGKLFANRQPGVAHLANEICLAGQQPDNLIFAKAQLPQAILHFGRSAKLFDAHGNTGTDAA